MYFASFTNKLNTLMVCDFYNLLNSFCPIANVSESNKKNSHIC